MDSSVTIEELEASAKTLTASFVETTSHVRMDSRSQLHFYIDYDPHANNVASTTCQMEFQILYSTEAADTEAQSGGSGSFTWKGHTEEIDQGDGTYTFEVKTWVIKANATANYDRDPNFARPIAAKVVKGRVREVNAGGDFGTYTVGVAAQSI